jgi:predicted ATPase/DNA-binding winged helix-turn-helix (wHTH) protein
VYEAGEWEIDLALRELRAKGLPVPIGGRAFEILEALVQSAGAVVGKDDLMARVWPGAVIEENTLQVHISAVRKALGPDRGMLQTASGRGYRLLGTWQSRHDRRPADRAAPPPAPAQAAGPSGPGNLPVAVSALIGRASAAQHLQDLLSAYRTVTLTGPGGIGKSALAFAVARSLLPSFQGDVWVVELVSLADPDLVASAVARVLGLTLGGSQISPESVARAIGARNLLLLLDNCEHVIDAAAGLAETMLRLCPRATVLATSREVLRIEGEYVYRVPPLDVPPPDDRAPGAVIEHSAVQLFIARAQALNADVTAEAENLAVIAAICRRLDGIPLAIEFAAARTASLGLREVAARLDDRFGLLAGGRRTALARHRTLRATLDWSYQLLPEPERRLLRHLAIFAAGFTLEAATAVMPGAGSELPAVAEALANLVGKSLVALDGSVPAGRWRLLETIRAYALEKLAEHDEAADAARSHAAFYRDLIAPAASPGLAESPGAAMVQFARDIDNIRAALDWAFSPAGDAMIGIHLTAACAPLWMQMLLHVECRERARRALAALGPEPKLDPYLLFPLLLALGIALFETTGEAEECGAVFGRALALAESLHDTDAQLRALLGMFNARINNGEQREAQRLAGRFQELASQKGDLADMFVGDRLIGASAHYGGDHATARYHIARVVDHYVAPESGRHTTWFHYDQRVLARAMLARVLWLQGLVEQAGAKAWASVEEASAAQNNPSLCYALGAAVCPIALRTGDLATTERAVAMLDAAAAKYSSIFWTKLGPCLEGALLIRRGEFRRGTTLLSATLDVSRKIGLAVHIFGFLGDLAEGLAGLGRAAEALAVIEEGLRRYDQQGLSWYTAELLRIQGEVLLADATARGTPAAEDCFLGALELARQQGALFWELRAATSLARLRAGQGRPETARTILKPVYDRFVEGFETADLRQAQALLNALSTGSIEESQLKQGMAERA